MNCLLHMPFGTIAHTFRGKIKHSHRKAGPSLSLHTALQVQSN